MLIAVSVVVLGIFAMQLSKKAVKERVGPHLTDKASDTAEVIDGRLDALFQFISGIVRAPVLRDKSVSYAEKSQHLHREAMANNTILRMGVADLNGNLHTYGSKTINVKEQAWYLEAMKGNVFISEPFASLIDNQLIMVVAVPVYDENRHIVDAINVSVSGKWLSEQIKDIVLGKSGECYITGTSGECIAHKNFELVQNQWNAVEFAKKDSSFAFKIFAESSGNGEKRSRIL